MAINFSAQQKAIFDFVQNGKGSAICIAVAGAGKTTTAIEAIRYMSGSVGLFAFNTDIAAEFTSRVKDKGFTNVTSSTLHSLGLNIWRQVYPRVKIVKDYEKFNAIADVIKLPFEYKSFVSKLLGHAKNAGIGALVSDTPASYQAIVDKHDLYSCFADERGRLPSNIQDRISLGIDYCQNALDLSINLAKTMIDFADMLYMPIRANVTPNRQFDWLVLDEAQDTNPIRRALCAQVLAPGGRLLAIGDPCQAIYYFTGADSDAMDLIAKQFNCSTLLLTVSYRCPKTAINYVQQWVSHIEAAANAPDGSEATIREQELNFKSIDGANSVILCRNNAPLVDLAFKCLRQGVACRVKGWEIGSGLVQLAHKWKRVTTLNQLLDKLAEYKETQITRLMAKGKEDEAQAIADKVETLEVIADNCETLSELKTKIDSLFSQDDNNRILTFSSIHKAKGTEYNSVYWLGQAAYQPSRYARQKEQLQQEYNLMYVAGTRTKQNLIHVIADTSKKRGRK